MTETNMQHKEQQTTEKARLRLTVTVDYELNGTPIESLKDKLRHIVDMAAGEDWFTDDLPATVLEYPDIDIQEEEPDLEAQAAELAFYAREELGVTDEDLDPLDDTVHDIHAQGAAAVNNGGLDAQCEYLVREFGYDNAFQTLKKLYGHYGHGDYETPSD